ncbi:MAG TPA: hypothetical protein VKU19_08090 [Bryobacteraceae bacterium]|nr:hypothetical protein [Bryobacteraceae bacterium]
MLFLAAALPVLFWSAAPDTAPALKDAGITHIAVPASRAESWKSVAGLTVETADPQKAVKLESPGVEYRADQASASRAPWLDSNGWQFLRQPQGRFYYDVKGGAAALAAAEAFSYGVTAWVSTDNAGLKPLAQMLEFLRGVQGEPMPPVADIGLIDDGTDVTAEVMNLMLRHNLLFRVVSAPDSHLKLNVRIGSKEYPAADAQDPGAMAQIIRGNLTDEKRSLRIYGSPVVIGRLTGSNGHVRVQLLNYSGATRKVDGLRVRVLGSYPMHHAAAAGSSPELQDYTVEKDATEFTLPELKTFAVIDLSR